MSLLRSIVDGLRSLVRKKNGESELDREVQSYLEISAREKMRAGMSRADAMRAARLEIGSAEAVKEDVRAWGWESRVETVWQDLRYGVRMLRKSPGFTAVAVLSLALGIGANTAIFSVVHALLLRWLPVPHPQQLYQVNMLVKDRVSDSFSYPVITALADRQDVFANAGGFSSNVFTTGPSDSSVRTPGGWVTGKFFATLELQPAAGRLLGAADDAPGAPLTAVISDGYWERVYHRDVRALGAAVLVEQHPVTVVGVMPAGFTGAEVGAVWDLVLPLQAMTSLSTGATASLGPESRWNRVVARLAPGLSAEQARARLKVVWPAIAPLGVSSRAPASIREVLLKSSIELAPGGTGWTPLRNQYTKPLYVLIIISVLVLLTACANVANLLLARSTARQREIAIRLAIGASRSRVMCQLLAESLLLAFIAAALGLGLARWGSHILVALVSSGTEPIPLGAGLNGTVLSFTMVVTIATGLLFGLAPAFRASGGGPGPALKNNERTGTGSRARLGPALVSVQAALSLLLLIAGGLFVRTLRNLQSVDPGFRHQGVLMIDVNARRVIHGDAQQAVFFRDSLAEIAQLHGVQSVALSNFTPISGGYWSQQVTVNGKPMPEGDYPFLAVSPSYFDTLRMPLIAGRAFALRDDASAPPVVIVNEEFVRRFVPDGHPLAQRVSTSDSTVYQNMEIVGVVRDSHALSLRDGPRPCVYVPYFQLAAGRAGFGTFEIAVDGSLTGVSRAAIELLRPRLPGSVLTAWPFSRQIENSIRRETVMAKLAGFFGALGLLLSAVGLYGLLAYSVARRTGEIGIRMALGAQRAQVVSMVVGGALRLVAIGVAMGVPAAWWASRLVSGMLYGLTATDPSTIAMAVAVLAAAAFVAGLLPAHRAAKVDPLVALRYE